MSRLVLPQICLLMAFFNQTSRYNTVQDEFHYKTLGKMVQKLKLRYKSPDIKTVCIKLLFCFKNVQITFEKCPGSRIPGSFLLETLDWMVYCVWMILRMSVDDILCMDDIDIESWFLHSLLWCLLVTS